MQTASIGLPAEPAPARQVVTVLGQTKWLQCAPRPAEGNAAQLLHDQTTATPRVLLTVVFSHTQRPAPSGFTATTLSPT